MVQIAAPQRKLIKKFYKTVSLGEGDNGFSILLDGKNAKTPARASLAAPSRALAEAIAEEWGGEGESVDFDAMRLTRLAATAIDLAGAQRDQWAEEIASYARSDLLCYRAETPAALVARQEKEWTPYLDWAKAHLGAQLKTTAGIVAVEQPADAIEAIRAKAVSFDDWRLIGAKQAAVLTGSAVLGLAAEAGAFAPEAIFAASRLDERFQVEQWGVDAEAAANEARLEAEFMATAAWLAFLR